MKQIECFCGSMICKLEGAFCFDMIDFGKSLNLLILDLETDCIWNRLKKRYEDGIDHV